MKMKIGDQHALGAWFDEIDEEDRVFIKRFLLASGSLKALAATYGISYPTVRLRLDRLIAKVEILDKHRNQSPFERTLRALMADGRIDESSMKKLLTLHNREIQGGDS